MKMFAKNAMEMKDSFIASLPSITNVLTDFPNI